MPTQAADIFSRQEDTLKRGLFGLFPRYLGGCCEPRLCKRPPAPARFPKGCPRAKTLCMEKNRQKTCDCSQDGKVTTLGRSYSSFML
eukprot:5136998-Amphidinium_carterae.1